MEQINVRRIQIKDFKDIYFLNQELGYTYPIEKLEERISFIIAETKDIILVAEQDNEVIGYIHGSPYELLYSDSLVNILSFVVKEKNRYNGVGNSLICSLEYWAKENGYSGIRLTSSYNRLNAHAFYQSHGYTHKKDQKNFSKLF